MQEGAGGDVVELVDLGAGGDVVELVDLGAGGDVVELVDLLLPSVSYSTTKFLPFPPGGSAKI